jgi:hypothetical protein
MKQYLKLIQYFLITATSFLSSSILVITPSQASSFALSEGALLFTNFSHIPSSTLTITDTNATSIFQGGNVTTQADAIAFLKVNPPAALTSSSGIAWGDNVGYLGIAESVAAIRGIFDIEENSIFAFNFASNLNLLTSIDKPNIENAKASGNISFALFDIENNNILDSFSLIGTLTTKGNNDFIEYEKIGNITLISLDTALNLGGNQEFATAYIDGYVERYFTNITSLALIEFQQSRVQVQTSVPEPSSILALLWSGGIVVFVMKHKKG